MFESLTEKLNTTFDKLRNKGKLTEKDVDDALREIRLALLEADVSIEVAKEFINKVKPKALGKEIVRSTSPGQMVVKIVNDELINFLGSENSELNLKAVPPVCMMVIGLQGSGKTTTIAKIASQEISKGKKVIIAAADTFRAAAVQQLEIWSKRVGAELVSGAEGSDPAGIAFKAYDRAIETKSDILLIDTAGRLQTQTSLMEQLKKINRVINKKDETAPHHRILIVDATAGQNVLNQIVAFKDTIDINGIIITKLDTSSKGGIIISISKTHEIPIHAIGVGEKQEDLNVFEAEPYARALLGLEIDDY